MSLLEALQLIGYSLGAVLPLGMGYLLFRQGSKRRLKFASVQLPLLGLAACMTGWHASNLVITLRALLGLSISQWAGVLRAADSIAVTSITICYSLLLHVHLYLWAGAHRRALTRSEQIRVYFSYIPCLFIPLALWQIWTGPYQPMLTKLSFFLLPFVLWIAYALGVVATTELLVARGPVSQSERTNLRTLALSFIGVGILVMASIGFGLGRGTTAGVYLNTFTNLGSLLPSALLAYYTYRYRYLELIIKQSLIVATFAAVVLVIYLYGIRRLGDWASARFGLRAGVIEAILILALTLMAAPLRGWLERSFRKLFERETALYREVVARIGTQAGQYRLLPQLLNFIESETASALSLRQVKIVLRPEDDARQEPWIERLLKSAETTNMIDDDQELRDHGFKIACALRRDDQVEGVMLVEADASAFTQDVRAVLEVLAGQTAIAVEDCRLANQNIQLERKVAEGKRLAALGQMAATVAHEVKNPLSAIKSIAQVMSEDEALKAQHARDLSLIVGETDRLNTSVTQLLSFASKEPPPATPRHAKDLVQNVVALFRVDANERHIVLDYLPSASVPLDGIQTAAVRDALSNLVLNALQATPAGGTVTIETFLDGNEIGFAVSDSGSGISAELQAQIWEPFFTTRQRGTGLGLAIVRKRMQEAGGSARLTPSRNGEGARFELRLPLMSEARP